MANENHTSSSKQMQASSAEPRPDLADLWAKLQNQAFDHETHQRILGELQDFVRLTVSALLFSRELKEQPLIPHFSDLTAFAQAETRLQKRTGQLIEQLLFAVGQVYDSHPHNTQIAQTAKACLKALAQLAPTLLSDIRAALQHDPAASDPLEVAFCYPGFHATAHYRLAHILHKLDVPLLPRMLTELAHRETGIDIHPGAQIGGSFFIDHGTGVVIGETAVVGEGVTLYQGVTLGAKRFLRDESGSVVRGVPRHPVLEEGVTVYAGATILGRITVGARSVIGGNVWLTNSVPPGSRITQQPCVSSYFNNGEGI